MDMLIKCGRQGGYMRDIRFRAWDKDIQGAINFGKQVRKVKLIS